MLILVHPRLVTLCILFCEQINKNTEQRMHKWKHVMSVLAAYVCKHELACKHPCYLQVRKFGVLTEETCLYVQEDACIML